ncbi:hypothetical protein D9M73_290680 [compost metagenome]
MFRRQLRQPVEGVGALDQQPLLSQELFGRQERRFPRLRCGAMFDHCLVGLQVLVQVGCKQGGGQAQQQAEDNCRTPGHGWAALSKSRRQPSHNSWRRCSAGS